MRRGREREQERDTERERSSSCRNDLNLPSVDPDAAVFSEQLCLCADVHVHTCLSMCVCVCGFLPNTPNKDLSHRDRPVQRRIVKEE